MYLNKTMNQSFSQSLNHAVSQPVNVSQLDLTTCLSVRSLSVMQFVARRSNGQPNQFS